MPVGQVLVSNEGSGTTSGPNGSSAEGHTHDAADIPHVHVDSGQHYHASHGGVDFFYSSPTGGVQ